MLCKMIRRGLDRRDRDENTFGSLITNDEVFQISKTEDVISHAEKQQTKYLAHSARQRKQCERLLFNDNKNCKRGRPIKTLEQCVL